MLKNIRLFLAKPFPQEENFFETLRIITAISVFVFAFLYVFRPFGLHTLESGVFALCLGFGITTFVVSLVYELIVVFILKIKGTGARFTFGKWVLYFTGAMLCISLGNFIFVRLVLFDDIQWSLYPYMIRGTFAVGIFPVIVVGAFALMRQEKKYQNIARELNFEDKRPVTTSPPGESTLYGIPLERIKYIEAMQNYINIGYINADEKLAVQTERATLKSISGATLGSSLLRCHRSFFVNPDAIVSTSGNAQGLLLSLSNCDRIIPVSRSFVSVFRNQ